MRIVVALATAAERAWAADAVAARHYLRSAPDPRSRPLCHAVYLAGHLAGCLWWGRPESTRCYRGGLTYGSAADVAAGRAAYDRWEVLNLSQLWLCPEAQPGGAWHRPGVLPGFTDRKGAWRSTLASEVIGLALARVGLDYLLVYPPCFVEEPYAIRAVLSYCDTRLHKGTVYRAAGFNMARRNADGIETWWTGAVAPLTPEADALVRERATTSARSQHVRLRRASLFDGAGG